VIRLAGNIYKKIGEFIDIDLSRRRWFRFTRNPLSIVGLVIVGVALFLALSAPYITPYPQDTGFNTNFKEALQPPSLAHLFGTDDVGRDVFTRTVFGFQYSLLMAAVVLGVSVLPGVALGLTAGYYRGSWVDSLVMRVADIFIAVPALVLALAVTAVLSPSLLNAMLAICLIWWPWYARLTYSISSSLRNEYFVQAAGISGASPFYIIFREIFPNTLGPILTKVTLDVGWVILLGSALSFVGLGAQPPTPDLGTMVATGGRFLPEIWWLTIFPAIAIIMIILGFNLLGDGIRDIFMEEVR